MSAPRLRTAVAALALAFVFIPATATPQATMRHLDGPTDARGCATRDFTGDGNGYVQGRAIARAERAWRNAVFAGGYGRSFQTWQNGEVAFASCRRTYGMWTCVMAVTPCRVNVNRRGITWNIRRD